MGDTLEAMAAPYPPELPPADFLWFQGFNVLPHKKLKESKLKANWGKLVFMKGIRPVRLKVFIVAQSSLSILWALIVAPMVEWVPSI
jgi:hypothetical protein